PADVLAVVDVDESPSGLELAAEGGVAHTEHLGDSHRPRRVPGGRIDGEAADPGDLLRSLEERRLLAQLRLGALAVGKVLDHCDHVLDRAVRAPDGRHPQSYGDQLAVGTQEALLELEVVARAGLYVGDESR